MAKNDTKPAPATEKVDTKTGEVLEEVANNVPALTAQTPNITVGGKAIKLKKIVNRILLRHPINSTVYVTFLSGPRPGKEIKGSKMAPAEMVTVREVVSGQEMDYILTAVLKGLLEENYPKDAFVGKSFAIFKEQAAEGKRYNNCSLAEIEV